MQEALQFRVSSALKDIIGRDLITDDFVAVFELVKNSYDAHAKQVDIFFKNIYDNNSKIIIIDDGKGMSYDDLKNKWLFVAYSAKKEGTEDSTFDYRDIIYHKRPFAGAKGIGRFSCDRLGKVLYLETTKKDAAAKTEVLITDWGKFENDIKEEFINVNVLHETKNKSDYDLKYGTVLEISELRSDWDRTKLLKLRNSLAKLINPSNKAEQDFKIVIHAEDEKAGDSQVEAEYDKVNGEVKNFIFETLGLKTTKIISKISNDGAFVTTELKDGGTSIYTIKERNVFDLLDSINITLYYLNMSAKQTFTRRMGLSAGEYGHVFLYKNGFRIYPYGEQGEDPLKLDARKAQGYNRYLGTRELIGQIEIQSSSDTLKETSSRADGLIKSKAYFQLEEFFWEVLKRLERYVVDVQQWGLSIEDDNNEIHSRITDFIAKLSGGNDIIDFTYTDNLQEIIQQNQSGSAETIFKNLNKIALETRNDSLLELTKKAQQKLKQIKEAKDEAERESDFERRRTKQIAEELGEKESENLFLRSVKSQDLDEVVSFLHHIGISAGIVDNYLTGLYSKLSKGQELPREQLLEIINIVVFENKKIQNISRFATKANFKLYTDAINLDIVEYLKEYINNIVKQVTNDGLRVGFTNLSRAPHEGKYRPIEINILVDNLLSNSKKAGATKFDVVIDRVDSNLTISFIDNGKGISSDKLNEIFAFGYTTNREGSGIGLYHISEIIKRIGGTISVESSANKGTTFKIMLK